jgi:hypothetical protein
MTRLIAILAALFLIASAGCFTTPLPIPPTMDPERIDLDAQNGPSTQITGGSGAVDPGDEASNQLRITSVGEPIDGPPFVEVEIAPDGSFSANVPGAAENRFYFELITPDEDIFLIALQGGMDGPSEAVDPGPDRDDDGSPDAIDCAPDDDTVTGRRCD